MYLQSVKVKNYKSFIESEEIHFSSGFNLIVGQNNSGKTALLEALSLRFASEPHLSEQTRPKGVVIRPTRSAIDCLLKYSIQELEEFWRHSFPRQIHIRFSRNIPPADPLQYAEQYFHGLREGCIKTSFADGRLVNSQVNLDVSHANSIAYTVEIDLSTPFKFTNEIASFNSTDSKIVPEFIIAKLFAERIYAFKAERLNIGVCDFGTSFELRPDASNLPEVLNNLHASNPNRFIRFNSAVRTVFPNIQQVTIVPVENKQLEIRVWNGPIDDERDDLAIPLAKCGSGIGQVLAMLYVVLNSDISRVIIIDEPNSFLHPGAARKLIEVLQGHKQHQYILSTHSPEIISSLHQSSIISVYKEEAVSKTRSLDPTSTQDVRILLAEVGSRLSDVFGADSILWVEGKTEELVFPKIVTEILQKPLLGTQIVGVLHTADFEKRTARTTIEIYKRLSSGLAVLPPAIGFLFDKEDKSDAQINDMAKISEGRVHFVLRRMFENYLLNPRAIAETVNSISGFRTSRIGSDEVADWLEQNRWNEKYIQRLSPELRSAEIWNENGHAGKLLSDLFSHFSETRVVFNKIEHSVALADWIIENSPEDFDDLKEILANILDRRVANI